MDLDLIKAIVNNNHLPDELKEREVIKCLAADGNVIPTILNILSAERDNKERLITESNSELSRALITLEDKNVGTPKAFVEKSFVIGEIKKHYLKWQNIIRCNFKVTGLP